MTELPLGSIQIILALRLTLWGNSADARVTLPSPKTLQSSLRA